VIKAQSLKGQVQVYCRFKPLKPAEEQCASITCYPEDNAVTAFRRQLFERQTFSFDRVFGPNTSQDDVFIACARPLATAVIKEKVNGCILAYGQTASGKTYTIEDGMLPRIATLIFSLLEPAEAVTFSALEIFNERLKDLLGLQTLSMRGAAPVGLTQVRIASVSHANRLFAEVMAARATHETNMNERSSRSHVIYSFRFLSTGAVLHLADLAGSEKVSKTLATGDRLDEAKSINRSLLALGNVVSSLSTANGSHIRFRDSKLTRVLQESLAGNSHTSLIVTCASDADNEQETLSTLRFGRN
jgi:kinesin family member 5